MRPIALILIFLCLTAPIARADQELKLLRDEARLAGQQRVRNGMALTVTGILLLAAGLGVGLGFGLTAAPTGPRQDDDLAFAGGFGGAVGGAGLLLIIGGAPLWHAGARDLRIINDPAW